MQYVQNLSAGFARFEKQAYLLIALAAYAMFAMAVTDTTFDVASQQVRDWTEGTFGLLVAFGVLATGLAMTIVKHSLMWLVLAVGVALAATMGPGILDSMFTATL
ncbi:MAG: TraA family conjugative transfer protein [Halothiobacillaceae bacterium]|jgi:conjugal transfer pilus assembly protein TraA